MDKIKVGVIGCGSIGVYHIASYHKSGKAEVTAICDINSDVLEKVKSEYRVKKAFTDYRKLLDVGDLDAVSICLPNRLHYPVTVEAFDAGKHVLCEKPMAMNTDEALKMIEARDRAGKKLLIGLTQRFRNGSRVLKSHIDAGELGEIYFAKCGYLRRSGIPGMGSWFTTKSEAGAGPIFDIGVHALDLTLWFMDNFRPVSATASSYAKFGPKGKGMGGWGTPVPGGPFDVEDLAAAIVRMENGATVFLEVSWAGYVGKAEFYSTLLGDKGGADFASMRIYTEEQGNFVEKVLHFEDNDWYLAEVEHFIDCIVNDREPITTADQMIGVQKALDAILESAETGREVRIEW